MQRVYDDAICHVSLDVGIGDSDLSLTLQHKEETGVLVSQVEDGCFVHTDGAQIVFLHEEIDYGIVTKGNDVVGLRSFVLAQRVQVLAVNGFDEAEIILLKLLALHHSQYHTRACRQYCHSQFISPLADLHIEQTKVFSIVCCAGLSEDITLTGDAWRYFERSWKEFDLGWRGGDWSICLVQEGPSQFVYLLSDAISQALEDVLISQSLDLLLEEVVAHFELWIAVIVTDHRQVELFETASTSLLNKAEKYVLLDLRSDAFAGEKNVFLKTGEFFSETLNTVTQIDQQHGLSFLQLFKLSSIPSLSTSISAVQFFKVDLERFKRMSFVAFGPTERANERSVSALTIEANKVHFFSLMAPLSALNVLYHVSRGLRLHIIKDLYHRTNFFPASAHSSNSLR